jgi:predicted dehydrogenase/threonine dehydrogenase-like Zn-dependent dehydrogenase
MQQVYLDRGQGRVVVGDVPEPALRPGTILVRTAWSAVSPGTERHALELSAGNLLRVARARPDLVRRVLDAVRRAGVVATYRKVRSKLDELLALGYSSSGTVIAVGEGAGDVFAVGDRVACGGSDHAVHGEVACVPVNLAARVPDGVPLDAAAFATLGAVAVHAARQAEARLSERFAVIGLGLVGQLCAQVLRACGCRVIGFDPRVALAEALRKGGMEALATGDADEQVHAALAFTDGVGVDGVVVAATSPSDAPMVAAAGMCRDRARVVAVGLVPHGLPREIAYGKELELKIARSYGPGRHDPDFEDRGRDLPIGYVRFTETRNLESFLELCAGGAVDPLRLVTHRLPVAEAAGAYDDLASSGVTALGVLIQYPEGAVASPGRRPPAAPARRGETRPLLGGEKLGVGCIGAGAFARDVLLPALRGTAGVALRRVVTARGLSAQDARQRFGFEAAGTDVDELLADPAVHLVLVLTRHDTHAELAARALLAGKHVFVEKPLALDADQIARVEEAARRAPGLLLVGFNRRFAPHARALRDVFAGRGPLVISARVNAGALPPHHWLGDPVLGGGRLRGEACHWIDLASFVCGDPGIASVTARAPGRGRGSAEDFTVTLELQDGTLAQVLYTASGSIGLGKELVEVHGGGASASLLDFRACTLHRGRRKESVAGGGKGHAEEMAALVEAARQGGPSPVPLDVTLAVTRATLDAHRALASAATSA